MYLQVKAQTVIITDPACALLAILVLCEQNNNCDSPLLVRAYVLYIPVTVTCLLTETKKETWANIAVTYTITYRKFWFSVGLTNFTKLFEKFSLDP